MDDVTVQDLITHAYDQKPLEFQNSFADLMAPRLAAAIDARKIEVAQAIFNSEEEVEDSETDVEIEDEVEDIEPETVDQEEPEDGATA